MNCPKCGTEALIGARFCEIDGTRLVADNTVDKAGFGICRCGAGPDAIDENGFCTECGIRRNVRLRDHIEIELSEKFAGVTDRGLRHAENQDDLALAVIQTAQDTYYIAVVCDGVSGSEGAASASAAAASTACACLERGIRDKSQIDIQGLMRTAISEANTAVCQLTYAHATAKDPPETTIVAAVVIGRTVVVGWAGDSRAYWITETDSTMLTRDHSWVNDVVDAGQMTEAEAVLAPLAHAIVRCLGEARGSADESVEPSIITCDLPEGSRLMLCTDGLWNYTATLAALSDLVRQEQNESPQDTTRRLVRFAVSQGGKDNITAVILAI